MEDKQSKKQNLRLIIAMCILPWLAVGGSAVMSILPDMSQALNIPENTVKLVSTLSSLAMVPSSIIGGIVAGKKIGFKTQLIGSSAALIVAGSLPFFLNNFVLILISRVIFGVAFGFISPISFALVFRLFEGDMRTRVLGFNSTSMYVGSVFYTLAGGIFCAISWRHAFLVHLLGLIPLVPAIILVPRIPRTAAVKLIEEPTKPLGTRISEAFPLKTVWFIAMAFAFQMLLFPVLVNTPFIISENGFGNATTASMVLATNTIAGAIASFAFAYIAKWIKRYALPLSLGICALGLAVVYSANSLTTLFTGIAMTGAGSAMMSMAMLLEVGRFIPKEHIGVYSGASMAAGSIGGFCLTGYLSMLSKLGFVSAQSPMLISSIGIAVLMCATSIYIVCSNRQLVKKAAQKSNVEV